MTIHRDNTSTERLGGEAEDCTVQVTIAPPGENQEPTISQKHRLVWQTSEQAESGQTVSPSGKWPAANTDVENVLTCSKGKATQLSAKVTH